MNAWLVILIMIHFIKVNSQIYQLLHIRCTWLVCNYKFAKNQKQHGKVTSSARENKQLVAVVFICMLFALLIIIKNQILAPILAQRGFVLPVNVHVHWQVWFIQLLTIIVTNYTTNYVLSTQYMHQKYQHICLCFRTKRTTNKK